LLPTKRELSDTERVTEVVSRIEGPSAVSWKDLTGKLLRQAARLPLGSREPFRWVPSSRIAYPLWMRVQDLLGWWVPTALGLASGWAFVQNLSRDNYSNLWLPLGGLILTGFMFRDLTRRRADWKRSHPDS